MSARTRRLIVLPVAIAAGLFIAVPFATGSPVAKPTPSSPAISSPAYWAGAPENEAAEHAMLADPASIYQGAQDRTFLDYISKARGLGQYTNQTWKNVGPIGGVKSDPNFGGGAQLFGAVGGIGTAIAVDQSDTSGNTAYLGTFGGLWKTTDGGKTLTELSKGFLRAPVGAIAVDPANAKNVYVGTGVSINTLSDDAVGAGVYVSHNGGTTFSRPSKNTFGYGVNAITVNPSSGTVLVGTNFGLYRSTNHGASFTKVPLPTNATHTGEAKLPLGSNVNSIVLRPGHPDEVTLSVGYFRGTFALPDGTVVGTGNGLYRSMSDGTPGSFQLLPGTSQLKWAGSTSNFFGRASLAYGSAPGQDQVLWVLLQDAGLAAGGAPADLPALPVSLTSGSVLNGVYRSGDDGATFRLAGTYQSLATALTCALCVLGHVPVAINYAPGVQSQYNTWIATDPVNPNRVYIGLEEAFQGDVINVGPQPVVSWHAMERYANVCGFLLYGTQPGGGDTSCPEPTPFYGGGSTHPDQHSVALIKTPNGVRIYSGNDGGWWVQDSHPVNPESGVSLGPGFDNVSWRSMNIPATVLPWDVNFLQNGDVVMALQDNGTIRVKKDGSAYNVCGGDGVWTFPGANEQSYYCGIPGLVIFGTTDDFRHLKVVSPGAPPTTGVGGSFLSPFAVDLSDPNHIMAAANAVWETTAGINSNTMDPTQTALLSSTWKNSIFTPPDLANPPTDASGNAIGWDSSALSVIGPVGYVAFCDQCRPTLSLGPAITDPAKYVHVEIATNVKSGCKAKKADSACWHVAASKGLPHQQISGIAIDPNDARTIYVSLRQQIVLGADAKKTGAEKVMVSHDAGEHFTDLSGNLPRADIHRLFLRDGRLIAASDVGVFTAKAGTTHWERLGKGLPAVPFRSMQLDRTGRYVVAGAYGRGAWTYDFGAAAQTPPTTIPKVPGGPGLATTGGRVLWPTLGAILLAAALLVVRRRRHT